MIPRYGRIILVFPVVDFGLSGTPAIADDFTAVVNGTMTSLTNVEISQGLGEIILNDALSFADFDPEELHDPVLTVTVGGVRNPRSFKPSLSV